MKIYIVTESNKESNLLLRSWVCFTEDQAKECLKKHYGIACTYNRIAGLDAPTDCLDNGFFFWRLQNDMELKYSITESKTFAE
jgi:hypothetical protein